MTPPTPTEIEALARELRLQAWHSDPRQFARWILTRFVRREERQHHFDMLLEDNARLRAELKGQRCNSSGQLDIRGPLGHRLYPANCPGCPACKPTDCVCGGNPHIECDAHTKPTDDGGQPTPKGDECSWCKHPRERHGAPRGYESACRSCYCEQFDGGRTLESVSKAEHQASELGASRADSAAPVVHVVKLHEDTVRALVAAILELQFAPAERTCRPLTEADILPKLKEPKP